jgi:hypothetical protein
MTRLDDACQFRAEARAAECPGCLERNGSIPPCVKAWLGSAMGIAQPGKIIPLRSARSKAA